MAYYEAGRWRPYEHDELVAVLEACLRGDAGVLPADPDHPGHSRGPTSSPATSSRTSARSSSAACEARGVESRDIRGREVRQRVVRRDELELRTTEYETSCGRELFLQYVTAEDRIAAFLRLSLPGPGPGIPEIEASAMIREVHTYGRLVGLGERHSGRSQHLGLGRDLIERAARIAEREGYRDLAVISSIGTRRYYRRLGFVDGELYQHRPLAPSASSTGSGGEMPATEPLAKR